MGWKSARLWEMEAVHFGGVASISLAQDFSLGEIVAYAGLHWLHAKFYQ